MQLRNVDQNAAGCDLVFMNWINRCTSSGKHDPPDWLFYNFRTTNPVTTNFMELKNVDGHILRLQNWEIFVEGYQAPDRTIDISRAS